eukprot:6184096-Pleurochrysis_carterae.AAC.2
MCLVKQAAKVREPAQILHLPKDLGRRAPPKGNGDGAEGVGGVASVADAEYVSVGVLHARTSLLDGPRSSTIPKHNTMVDGGPKTDRGAVVIGGADQEHEGTSGSQAAQGNSAAPGRSRGAGGTSHKDNSLGSYL